jgi:hypothetical protein
MGPTPQRFPTDGRLADAGFLADGVRIEPTGVSLPGYAAAFLRGDGKG